MSSSSATDSFVTSQPPSQQPNFGASSQASGLRPSQSFTRFDEGYSGEETPTNSYDDSQPRASSSDGMRDRSSEVKIPAWMTGLNDALREEYAYKLVRTLPTSHIASLVNRLVPILHLDFIQILPSELSLQILSYLSPKSLLDASLASKTWRRYALEPSLWKSLYKGQGWEANEEEVKKFETEVQLRAAEDRQRAEAQSLGAPAGQPVSGEAENDAETQDWTMGGTGPAEAQRPLAPYTGALSDEDEMYPSPHRCGSGSQTNAEPPLTIAPTLTTPGYLSNPPRLNWAFLFKNRRKLDDNWLHNRCTPFQIPHPNYPHEGHDECIYTLQYSPKWLCSGSRDKSIRVWNIKTRRLRGPPLRGHKGSVLCLQFDESPEEDVIISGSSDASVIVWRFSTGEPLKVIQKAHDESVLNLRFSKKWLVTCSKDKAIKIWNRDPLDTTDPEYPWHSKLIFGPGRAPLNHPHHPDYQPNWTVSDPAAASGLNLQNPFNQNAAAYAKAQRKFLPRRLDAYTATNSLQGHVAAVNAIQLKGNEIVSASGDRVIKLWNLATGSCEKTFVGHQKGIACIQFDGRTIVSGSSDMTIRVFDRDTQAEIATLRGHSALVRTVQATRNKIVSGSYDETVRIWRWDEEAGEWMAGPVLRQAQAPQAATAATTAHTQLQMAALQQFQATAANNGVQPSVQMHQVQPVGAGGLAGAIAASQLLPGQTQQFLQSNQSQDQSQGQSQGQPQAQPPPQPQHQPQPQPQQSIPPTQSIQPIVPPPQQQQPQQQAAPPPPGAHRVFKLQFDARWIICCSQDHRIVGWDYAADEEGIIEASRFFKGG